MPDSTPNMRGESSVAPQGAGPVNPEPTPPARRRIDSVDLLRGIVMVIMMLDHTRDFIHYGVLLFDPLDLSKTTTALFLTRSIVHFCAPVFVFMEGKGAYLQFAWCERKLELLRYFISRCNWAVLLGYYIVRFGVFFST